MAKNIAGLKKKEQQKLALAEKLEAEFGPKAAPEAAEHFNLSWE